MSTPAPETSASPTRFGPLTRSDLLALKHVRRLDSDSEKRVQAHTMQYTRAITAENAAAEKRWAELAEAVTGSPVTVPPGFELSDVVEGDQTFLVLVPLGTPPSPSAAK